MCVETIIRWTTNDARREISASTRAMSTASDGRGEELCAKARKRLEVRARVVSARERESTRGVWSDRRDDDDD